jgi:hypothetical protein
MVNGQPLLGRVALTSFGLMAYQVCPTNLGAIPEQMNTSTRSIGAIALMQMMYEVLSPNLSKIFHKRKPL